jgi:hypothetical protein
MNIEMAERKPESGDLAIARSFGAYAKPDKSTKSFLFYISKEEYGKLRREN